MIFKENRPLKGRFLLNGGVQEKSNPRRRPADRADNELGAEIRFCANSRDKIILTRGQVYLSWWSTGDSNSSPLRCQRSALAK